MNALPVGAIRRIRLARQHATPVLIPEIGPALTLQRLPQTGGEGAVSEAYIQALIHDHPSCLPIADIDPMFVGAVPICRELQTPAGPIDNFMVTPTGLPVLVECKLWRNAEARREVVGQVLDYAKELARFTTADLRRETAKALKSDPDHLFELVRRAEANLDEVQFDDALSMNLRRGRFLLLIVGDGIREGVEAIAEYLQTHAGLHFSIGLVELPIFALPDGSRMVTPRVVAHSKILTRTVIALPDGHAVRENGAKEDSDVMDPERTALDDKRQQFWKEFLDGLKLDDPEQPMPRPPRMGYVSFMLPAPEGSSWLTVYRDQKAGEVGIFLSSSRNSAGEHAAQAIAAEWEHVSPLLGPSAKLVEHQGRTRVIDSLRVDSLDEPEGRQAAFAWLRERTNTFINVIRPRVRSAVADYLKREG